MAEPIGALDRTLFTGENQRIVIALSRETAPNNFHLFADYGFTGTVQSYAIGDQSPQATLDGRRLAGIRYFHGAAGIGFDYEGPTLTPEIEEDKTLFAYAGDKVWGLGVGYTELQNAGQPAATVFKGFFGLPQDFIDTVAIAAVAVITYTLCSPILTRQHQR